MRNGTSKVILKDGLSEIATTSKQFNQIIMAHDRNMVREEII